MSAAEETLLSLQQAAARLGCHYQTVYKRVRSGEIPALVAGGQYRIRNADLDEWLAGRGAADGAADRPSTRDWPAQADAFQAVLRAGDASAARAQVDRLIAGGATVADLCDRLFAPVLFRIGELWSGGGISIADEHRASRIVEGLLERAASSRGKPGRKLGTVVVAAPAGDRHSLAAQMAAAGLRADGFDVHFLGADLPGEEIAGMAERVGADVVALSWCVAEREGLRDAIDAVAALGIPVMVGGNGIGGAEALTLGATRYGASVAEAQAIARELARAGG